MPNLIILILKKTFLYRWFSNYRTFKSVKKTQAIDEGIISDWKRQGRPVPPPPLYKIQTVQKYGSSYNINILIETGTYLGGTIDACKSLFNRIISIELNNALYERAKILFANDPNIELYQGDSGNLLNEILHSINQPCLFWLDGHYSEGVTSKGELNTPVLNELKHIFKHKITNHVILIDDARIFIGQDDYPSIAELKDFIYSYRPDLQVEVKDDIIRIY